MTQVDMEAVTQDIVKRLKTYGAYIYSRSAQGNSFYIKFGDPRIRSLRISDHKGRRKYKYKWNLRTDTPTFKSNAGGSIRYFYNINEKQDLIKHIRNYARKILKNDQE